MHPFKIFVFTFTILALALLYSSKDSIITRHTTQVDSIPSEMALPDSIEEVTEVVTMDTLLPHTFFEASNIDSCLAGIRNALSHSGDSLVRIIFYGDSQLEGDFITKPIRDTLQYLYGGAGIGFMPAEMYFNSTEKVAIYTSDFEKEMVAYKGSTQIQYGLYGRCFVPKASSGQLTIKNRNASHRFTKLKILYSGNAALQVKADDQQLQNFGLSANVAEVQSMNVQHDSKEISLVFSGSNKLKLYGLLLDPDNGVVVDHVAFRGNLNLMFNRFGDESVNQMADFIKPSLVVLQFGLNVIPDIREDYHDYQVAVERDIQLLKNLYPGLSIIVVGAPDMAHKVDGVLTPYAHIHKIVQAQKLAAENQQVAFWNMRQAMGGPGSVIDWVDNDFARTDYAHLNEQGAQKIARIFSRDLLTIINKMEEKHDGLAIQ